MAGAGGWGDPLEREASAVLEDVIDSRVSVEAARTEYGIVISEQGTEIDEDASVQLKLEMNIRRDQEA